MSMERIASCDLATVQKTSAWKEQQRIVMPPSKAATFKSFILLLQLRKHGPVKLCQERLFEPGRYKHSVSSQLQAEVDYQGLNTPDRSRLVALFE